ncbi:hypothetical protein PFISCL1PPCAC_11613, partial [Pristionchus fissidentatus]
RERACRIKRVIRLLQEWLSMIPMSFALACHTCWLEHCRWSTWGKAVPMPWPPTDSAAMVSFMDQRTTCFLCGKRDDCKQELSLFSLNCGHFACRTCWLDHCRWALEREFSPIPCPNGDCNVKLTIGRASTLLNDAAIGIMREIEWRTRLSQRGNLQCASCKLLREPFFPMSLMQTANCVCGCYTCVRCKQLEHAPLGCDDAAIWSRIRAIDDDATAMTEASRCLSLSPSDYEQCMTPSRLIQGDEWKNNIRIMKQYHRVNCRKLEKAVATASRMIELRTVQVLAKLKQMPIANKERHAHRYIDKDWCDLERRFYKSSVALNGPKEKALYLTRTMDYVLRYYH